MQLGLAALGVGLLAIGVIKINSVGSATDAATLCVIGAVLVISPFVIDRVERVSVSATGLELRLTRQISELGAPKTARILDRSDLASFAESYALTREDLSDPAYRDARVHLKDRLVARAAALAEREKFDAGEVRELFKNGTPIMRVLALGLMEGDPSLADGPTVLSAIADSRSGNEQFHGLRLVLSLWPDLTRSERHAVQAAVAASPHISPASDRKPLADQVLSRPI